MPEHLKEGINIHGGDLRQCNITPCIHKDRDGKVSQDDSSQLKGT